MSAVSHSEDCDIFFSRIPVTIPSEKDGKGKLSRAEHQRKWTKKQWDTEGIKAVMRNDIEGEEPRKEAFEAFWEALPGTLKRMKIQKS